MSKIMSLEGPSMRALAAYQGNVDFETPNHAVKATWQLSGILDPIVNYPGWAIGGLVLGMWLAGTATGRSVVAKGKSLIGKKR